MAQDHRDPRRPEQDPDAQQAGQKPPTDDGGSRVDEQSNAGDQQGSTAQDGQGEQGRGQGQGNPEGSTTTSSTKADTHGGQGGQGTSGGDPAATKSLPTDGGSGSSSSTPAANKSLNTSSLATGKASGAADKTVAGDGSSHTRRYAGKAAGGAVEGGVVGGAHGAAVGAGKAVAAEAGKDAVKGAKNVTGIEGPSRGNFAAGTAAAASAPPAVALGASAALMAWLKTMFFSAAAATINGLKMLWLMAKGVAKGAAAALMAPFMGIGSFVGSAVTGALGLGTGAVIAPITAAASAAATGVVVLSLGASLIDFAQQTSHLEGQISQETTDGCVVEASAGGGAAESGATSAKTLKQAKIAYSVLKSWGMPEENIAGILGNWDRESGIDPTAVESIFTEPFRIGPRKKAIWEDNFTHIPGQSHGGIGLGQWSNARTIMLLDFAKQKDMKWYDIRTQLAFLASGDNPGDVQNFRSMIDESKGTPAEAAMWYHDNWERSADDAAGFADRKRNAKKWFTKMSGWKVDDSVLGDVEDLMGDVVGTAGGGSSAAVENCAGENGEGGTNAGGASWKGGKTGNKIIDAALSQLGMPYSWGGGGMNGPSYGIQQGANIKGFDCSGLTQYAYWQGNHVKTGGYTGTDWDHIKGAGKMKYKLSQLEPGDMIFFHMSGGVPAHVGLWMGEGQMVHAPRTGKNVEVVKVKGSTYWESGFVGGGHY